MSAIADCDQHVFEPATPWRDSRDPTKRDLVIAKPYGGTLTSMLQA